MGAHASSRAAHAQAVLDAIRRIVQALHESSRWAEKHLGVTGAQLFVLQRLAEAPDLSLTELSARTRTHQSSVSTVVSRLVERGLVRRARSPKDARRVVLRLTPKGERLVHSAPDLAQGRLIRSIENLPPAARRALARSLGAVTRAMAVERREAVMFFHDDRPRKPKRRHA